MLRRVVQVSPNFYVKHVKQAAVSDSPARSAFLEERPTHP